jgi:hypothetical protein
MKYTVTNVVQSQSIDAGAPVEVNWYRGSDLASAIAAMAQSACHGRENALPEQMRIRVLSVSLTIDEED